MKRLEECQSIEDVEKYYDAIYAVLNGELGYLRVRDAKSFWFKKDFTKRSKTVCFEDVKSITYPSEGFFTIPDDTCAEGVRLLYVDIKPTRQWKFGCTPENSSVVEFYNGLAGRETTTQIESGRFQECLPEGLMRIHYTGAQNYNPTIGTQVMTKRCAVHRITRKEGLHNQISYVSDRLLLDATEVGIKNDSDCFLLHEETDNSILRNYLKRIGVPHA